MELQCTFMISNNNIAMTTCFERKRRLSVTDFELYFFKCNSYSELLTMCNGT